MPNSDFHTRLTNISS